MRLGASSFFFRVRFRRLFGGGVSIIFGFFRFVASVRRRLSCKLSWKSLVFLVIELVGICRASGFVLGVGV